MNSGREERSLSLPHDANGFVRRSCPGCRRSFKVRWTRGEGALVLRSLCALVGHVNAEEVAGGPDRFCPYCGLGRRAHLFWTGDQQKFLRDQAAFLRGEVRYHQLRQVQERLQDNPYITFVLVRPDAAVAALPPEPDDMRIFHLVCCGEPVKLLPGWTGVVHCHFCRSVHAVGA